MRRIAAVAAVVGGLMLPAHPATASCAADAGPDGSPVIFVGTAEAERRGYTRFAVEEVWAGPDLAPEVWVLSGQEQPPWPVSLLSAVGSSADADFVHGDRYVVGASESFATSACSISSGDEATSRPDAREPVAGGDTGADPPMGPLGQACTVAGIVGLMVATIGLVRRIGRRRS